MSLIDRYLHEVGRYLPAKNKADILAELRSHLLDTLEERGKSEASEADVTALLIETGSPRKVAQSYPGGQNYLIGPDLYPFFQLVAGIVLAAVIGSQLLAVGVNFLNGENLLANWETWAGLVSSIPSAFGAVVIVFIILQHFGVRPDLEEEPWNPQSLPKVSEEDTVSKGERVFGIVAASILMAVLALFPDKLGVYQYPGGFFYPNPVLTQYLVWIMLALLAGIGMDAFLLWQGRWTLGSRVARITINAFEIAVLVMLVQGHNQWLTAHGSQGFFASLAGMAETMTENLQRFGMEMFRMAFVIALVVLLIETVVMIVKLIRGAMNRNQVPGIS